MKDVRAMNLISLGVFLLIGPGMLFLISGYIDCSTAVKDKIAMCKTFVTIGGYMIIPMLSGVGLTAYVAIFSKPDNQTQKEPT